MHHDAGIREFVRLSTRHSGWLPGESSIGFRRNVSLGRPLQRRLTFAISAIAAPSRPVSTDGIIGVISRARESSSAVARPLGPYNLKTLLPRQAGCRNSDSCKSPLCPGNNLWKRSPIIRSMNGMPSSLSCASSVRPRLNATSVYQESPPVREPASLPRFRRALQTPGANALLQSPRRVEAALSSY